MRKDRVSQKGFTLIELVIVIVLVGILSSIGVPVYRDYMRKAYLAEGRGLCGSIIRAEKEHHVATGNYLEVTRAAFSTALAVDASENQYFREFQVTVDGDSCDVTAFGTDPRVNGLNVHYTVTPNAPPQEIN